MSKFAWYVCMCIYVYIYIYIYIYVLMTAICSVQSLSVIMSVKKKWQKIPQWSGMMITVIALCRWGQFCLLFKMACCGRVRVVTVIVIICHCCYCFCCFPRLRNSDRTSSLTNYDIILFPEIFLYDTYHYICMIGPLLKWTYHQLSNVEPPPAAIAGIHIFVGLGHCDSFADRAPVDFTCGCPALKWVRESRL